MSYTTSPTLSNRSFSSTISEISTCKDEHQIPICMIEGFMSNRNLNIFAKFITQLKIKYENSNLKLPLLINLDGGGVRSAYDSAVDLFYQLKGGQTDFGLIHSNKHGHNRFGNFYSTAKYEAWDTTHPIHCFAHSFGGNTVLMLQKLLDLQIFYDSDGNRYNTSSNWIRSLTTISSPFNGTTATLQLGHKIGDPSFIGRFCLGRLLYVSCYLYQHFQLNKLLPNWIPLDFKMDHFSFDKRDLSLALGFPLFDSGLDNAAYDLNLERNLALPKLTFKNSFYRSYAATMTTDTGAELDGDKVPIQHWCTLLAAMAHNMGKTYLSFWNSLSKSELQAWKSNDGVCPLSSQYHPDTCNPDYCTHLELNTIDKYGAITSGHWYTSTIKNCSHIDIIPGFKLPTILSDGLMKLNGLLGYGGASNGMYDEVYLDRMLKSVVEDYFKFLNNNWNLYGEELDGNPLKL